MSKFSNIRNEYRFQKEIKKNLVCLSINPRGIDINWPKSYANLYYKNTLSRIYNFNNSPIIIQINDNNKIIDRLWNGFFVNPIILRGIINDQQSFNLFKEKNKDLSFDIIIIKNYKNIDQIFKVIKFLKSKLKVNGIIVIENIYFDVKLVTQLFLRHSCEIFDFRLNRFLIDNCIIEIKRNSLKKIIIYKPFLILKYFYFFLLEIVFYILYIIKINLK